MRIPSLPSLPSSLRRALRWCRTGAVCLAVLYLALGFVSLRLLRAPGTLAVAALPPLSAMGWGKEEVPFRHDGRTVVRGVISVHTGRSHDAEGSLEDVALAARRTGLDFVLLGDHPGDWLDGDPDAMEPRREAGVLLVPGLELVVSGVGRTLAVGLDTFPRRWEAPLDELAARADRVGGFLSVVHPRSPRSRERWSGLDAPGVHAWESFDVSEMARLRLKDRWAAYHVASFLGGLVVGRGNASLAGLWREGTTTPAILSYDSARARAPVTLTGGLNHHPKARWGSLLFPGYDPFFRTVVNHVLLDEAELSQDPLEARGQIIQALKAGRVYVTLGAPEGADGFDLEGVEADGARVEMGGALPLGAAGGLAVHLPDGGSRRYLLRVMRNGVEAGWVQAGRGEELLWPVEEPGVYRVEVFRSGIELGGYRMGARPWILSNPVEFYRVTSEGNPTPP